MAALWDHCAGDYARGQDWNPPDGSMWDAKLVRQAKSCLRALKDFESWRMQQRASSVQHPASAASSPMQEWADFTLAVMMAWCKRVSVGVMAHGPLLAHARQCGHDLVKKTTVLGNGEEATFLVPKFQASEDWTLYPWQEHGCHGLDAITTFLKNNGFWTAVDMEVSNVPPPMRGRAQGRRMCTSCWLVRLRMCKHTCAHTYTVAPAATILIIHRANIS